MNQSDPRQRKALTRKLGLAIAATVVLLGTGVLWGGKGVDDGVALSQLPPQALATERLIRAGGPFPYDKDGTVFGNRERLLPLKDRGYYREYTVKTPGARDRGARRLVCGGFSAGVPDACFYTDDHYASFRRVVLDR